MHLMAVAAFKRVVLVAGVRVVLLVVALEAPGACNHLVHAVAAAARAELLGGKLLARGQHARGLVHRIAVARPCHCLGHLRGELGLVAAQACVAGRRMLRDQLARVALAVRLHVLVHGAVADGVAEAGLLVPHPRPNAGYQHHRHDDARHDDAAPRAFRRGGSRVGILRGTGSRGARGTRGARAAVGTGSSRGTRSPDRAVCAILVDHVLLLLLLWFDR